jgi:hypothetical protein
MIRLTEVKITRRATAEAPGLSLYLCPSCGTTLAEATGANEGERFGFECSCSTLSVWATAAQRADALAFAEVAAGAIARLAERLGVEDVHHEVLA